MRGATYCHIVYEIRRIISIHAPHARSDPALMRRTDGVGMISIHAPHARSDSRALEITFHPDKFQSTLLMRGATPCFIIQFALYEFQSTLLMRGATHLLRLVGTTRINISIHAPHARSDFEKTFCQSFKNYFNPRSSCEERPTPTETYVYNPSFQSTLLMRGATRRSLRIFSTEQISIHAPHARSDSSVSSRRQPTRHFNPRSSCEERPVRGLESALGTLFQSTLLMRGATRRGGHGADARADFNPRSSCEERLDCGIHAAGPPNFNPRSSCEERRAGEAGQLSRILFQSTLLMRGATGSCRARLRGL